MAKLKEEFGELVDVRSQRGFARKFGISKDTTTIWNRIIKELSPVHPGVAEVIQQHANFEKRFKIQTKAY